MKKIEHFLVLLIAFLLGMMVAFILFQYGVVVKGEEAQKDSGFWEYTYPTYRASADTFIVTMQDSLWITGERPKTEIRWYGWDRYGIWWFLRPEIKKEEE